MASELEVGKVVVGDSTNNHAWVTTKSTPGYYSGIKLTRGAGTFADDANNNFGFIVTDAGLSAAKFTSPGADVTGRTDFLTITSTGAVSIPSAAGTQIALTVKGGSNLVDHIALNITNQAGDTGTNIRNNGQLFATALATFSGGIALQTAASNDSATASEAFTLDKYETGTFTITEPTAGTAITGGVGKYTRIGDRVFITVEFTLATVSNGSHFKVTGLPFPVPDDDDSKGLVLNYSNKTDVEYAVTIKNTSEVEFRTDSGGYSTCTNASGGTFNIQGHYRTA